MSSMSQCLQQTKDSLSVEEYIQRGKITPMVRQYVEVKRAHPGCLILYRLGDFYECFFEDAHIAADVLDITLTGRGKGDDRFSMAGIPAHAAKSYIGRLVEAGHRVGICEQVEDAAEAKGLVKREVVRIITPGMVVDDELLDPRSERLVGAISLDEPGRGGAVAFLDLSTGAFRATVLDHDRTLSEELIRVDPRELLFSDQSDEKRFQELTRRLPGVSISLRDERVFDSKESRRRLIMHFGVATLVGFGVEEGRRGDLVAGAAGALIRYASEANREAAVHIDRLDIYDPGAFLVLDSATRSNLEILESLHGGRKKGSLLGLMDKTATAMGGRCLRGWLARPLVDLSLIRERQQSVEHLVACTSTALELHGLLKELLDIERLLGRLALGHGNARDLRGLQRSLSALPGIKKELKSSLVQNVETDILGESSISCSLLLDIMDRMIELPELADLLDRALVDEPPATLKDGGMVRFGYDEQLDELLDLAAHGKDHLLKIEAEEREATGISSLKVRHNRVFGYYIEITKANLHLTPSHYIRKQTTSNAERFITPKLQSWEEKVVNAEEKSRLLEQQIFESLRRRVLEHTLTLGTVAEAVSELDSLLSLSLVAISSNWSKPEVHGGCDLIIEDGRHPVVEDALRVAGESYVPSDLPLHEGKQFMIVTGPNMSGKSTVMRMAALVVLLSHTGSFVPAKKARVGLCDRIFTRVGASDDLAGGRSTFMVEMTESAAILNQATERSFVVLDEIGRGTSTFDGLSIAWAVAEELHDRIGCRALFATHYHELTDLAKDRDGVENYTVAVREWNDEIVFLRRLIQGAANRSYGIHVARLAGLPRRVLERATEVLANLESTELDETGRFVLARTGNRNTVADGQLSLFAAPSERTEKHEALNIISEVEPDQISPLEALNLIYRLKSIVDSKSK